jgi:uncharacterized protein (DUF1499 family)
LIRIPNHVFLGKARPDFEELGLMRHLIIEEPYSDSALWSRRLAVFAMAVIAIGLIFARAGLDPSAVLAVLGSAIVIACLAVLCAGAATVAIWRTGRKGVGLLLTGSFIALLILAYPAYLTYQAVRLPALHDVSTDIDDPPAFSLSAKALAARHGFVPASVAPESRQVQLTAYPDVQPIILDLDSDDAYQTVLATAAALHWKVIDARPPGGRMGLGHVDAIAHGMFLGFPNDVTIRIRPLAGQTRIDVRSVSRVGRHDFGANAKRILAFSDELKSQADQK